MTEPTALDQLDPGPVIPCPDPAAHRPKPKTARRVTGPEERGVRADLAGFPPEYRKCALAAQALQTAREIDSLELLGRDRVAARAQVRQCMVQLREWAPGETRSDPTGEARDRIEQARLHAV